MLHKNSREKQELSLDRKYVHFERFGSTSATVVISGARPLFPEKPKPDKQEGVALSPLCVRTGPTASRSRLICYRAVRVETSQAALDAERRQAMSYSISILLTRNLHDVFGENDPARRRAAIGEIFTEDCVFYDPRGVYRARDEIDRVAAAIRATHPEFRYQPIAKPEESGNGGRVQWVSGRPGEAPAYAGTDFIVSRDGRIAALYLFFDKLP